MTTLHMGFKGIHSILLLVAAAFIISCGGPRETGGTELTDKESAMFQRKFFQAQSEKAIGNLEKANVFFNEALAMYPTNDAVMYEIAQLEIHFGNFEAAKFMAEQCVVIDGKNEWYRLLMARIYVDDGSYANAAEQFAAAIEINPDQLDAYFDLAHAQLLVGQAMDAVATYDALESRVGINPDLSIAKHEIYMEMGEIEPATRELEKLAEHFVSDMNIQSLLAQFYLGNGETDKAMEVYARMENFDSDNGLLQMQLSEYYASKGDDEKSYQALVKAFKSTDVGIDQKVSILLKYYSLTEMDPSWLDEAYQLLDIVMETHPSEAKAAAMYADFLLRDAQVEEARDKYRTAVKLDQSRHVVWTQLLILDAELRDYSALQEESSQALELFPTMPIFYLYNGMAALQLEDFEDAVSALSTGKEFVVEDDAMLAQFYSTLGDTYHLMGEDKASDEAYDQCLIIEPNNAFVLNNYAYYLALRKQLLDKAQEMAEKANALDPGNPSFEDTLGWVFFQSEDYKSAILWLSKAESNGASGSPEVLEHLGDAYFKDGDNVKAMEYWTRAKDKGGNSEILMKKIADQQWYEG